MLPSIRVINSVCLGWEGRGCPLKLSWPNPHGRSINNRQERGAAGHEVTAGLF
jgi:hypothetical protein